MDYEKRVDLRMEYDFRVMGKRVVRGKAIEDKDGIYVDYRGHSCRSWDALKEILPHLRAIVTGDRELRATLETAGFKVEDLDKKKTSLHVTINTNLMNLVDGEADEKHATVSRVISDILNEHYGTNFS